MRWIRDIALLLLLCAIGAGILWIQTDRNERQAEMDRTRADTQRLEREIRFRAATKAGELNQRGWPATVDPTWFDSSPPHNALLGGSMAADRPWVEIAPEDQAGLFHPPVRLVLNDQMAGFWYNPFLGVVRARVPVAVSDEVATAMYNTVNDVNITTIQWVEKPEPTKPNANAEPADGAKKDDHDDTPKGFGKKTSPSKAVIVVRYGPAPAKKP